MTAPDITTSWHTYPKIFALGHRVLRNVLEQPDVIVEEKVDGSQFSFGVFNGELRCRSKGAVIDVASPPALFSGAVATAKKLAEQGALNDGWTYRGEAVQSCKHNTQVHARVPYGNFVLFDVNTGHESYLQRVAKELCATGLGLEIVPLLYRGPGSGVTNDALRFWLNRESMLGGCRIEGVVIKQYVLVGPDAKTLFGKYVSEAFKEAHKAHWPTVNPKKADIVESLSKALTTEARWAKAVQHLRDAGKLTDSPADIGALIKAVQGDVKDECTDMIKDALFKWGWPLLERQCVKGLAQWYKDRLAQQALSSVA